MSSLAPSYVDDGRSFTRRLPPTTSHTSISHWLNATHSDTVSAYTGSYIDDGLDLSPSTGTGFGAVNKRFYKHKKRRDHGDTDELWNDEIACAIGGDMQRSLAKLRDISSVEVKRSDADAGEERRRRDKRKGVVRVPAPLKWGTFVIRDDSGRCVVVDEGGEYDSGPVEQSLEKTSKSRRWVKAARSPSPPVHLAPPLQEDIGRQLSGDGQDSRSRRKSRGRPRTLSPVPESDYSTSSDDHIKVSVVSPTDFIMTGGLSGWPSPTSPSRAVSPERSPIIPHAITWEGSTSPHAYSTILASASTKSKRSSGHTLPHGWTAAPASPRKSVCSSIFTHFKAPSLRRISSKSDYKGKCREGQESRLNYQPPDIIEVIYDETPPGEVSYSQSGWGSVKAASARIWSETHQDRKGEAGSWQGVADAETIENFGQYKAGSDLGWAGSGKGSAWEGSKDGHRSQSIHSWDDEDVGNGGGDWDGFERRKTTSEVSVAGGSERSWPASIHTVQSHRSQRSHTSRRSSRHSPTDWIAGQAVSKTGSNAQWGGSAIQNEHDSPSKYQNGFDEDDATHLNDIWGGNPVRVASTHKTVVGWD